jgi:nitrite reductase/ring-hydroxylating ferredoxin subunit
MWPEAVNREVSRYAPRVSPTDLRFPFTPFPDGWYAVGLSRDLPRGSLEALPFLGQEIVLFRTASGRAVAADAHCPHLGAHLEAGRVEGELLRCSFHGFAFDGEGTCRRVPYSEPPSARLGVRPLRERNGLILVFHDAAGALPGWEVPELDTTGWTELAVHRWRVRTHPQETTENSVDLGHLSVLHGYGRVEMASPLTLDGPNLHVAYRKTRRLRLAGLRLELPVEFDVRVHGLGYSHVDVRAPTVGLHARLLVLPVPVTREAMDLRIAVSIRERSGFRGPGLPLRMLPSGIAARLVRSVFLRWGIHDVQQDIPIWESKRYVDPPGLARGDGPIGRYRAWCRQFYPDAAAPRAAVSRARELG